MKLNENKRFFARRGCHSQDCQPANGMNELNQLHQHGMRLLNRSHSTDNCGGVVDQVTDMLDTPQLTHFTRSHPPARDYSSIKYHALSDDMTVSCVNTYCVMSLTIVETMNGHRSTGGTTFRALLHTENSTPKISVKGKKTVSAKHPVVQDKAPHRKPQIGTSSDSRSSSSRSSSLRSTCSVADSMSGVYTVCCVLPDNIDGILERTILTVHMEYIHMDAFNMGGDIRPRNLPVFTSRLPERISSTIPKVSAPPACSVQNFNNLGGWWHRTKANDKWKWITERCEMQLLSDEKIVNCVKAKYNSNLFLLGDSHIRFTYQNVLQKMGIFPKGLGMQFEHDHNVSTVRFLWSPYAKDLLKNLKIVNSTISKSKLTNKFLLVVDSGAWDLRYQGAVAFLNNSRSVMDYVAKMRCESYANRVTFVWLGLVAYPDTSTPNMKKDARNNGAVAAQNAWLRQQVQASGVGYVDPLPMTLPMQDQAVCRAHYLCGQTHKATNTVSIYGDVGMHLTDLIMQYACL